MNIFEEYKSRHKLTFPCIKRAAPTACIICRTDSQKQGSIKWLLLTISQHKKDHQPSSFLFQWYYSKHNALGSYGSCISKVSDYKEIEWDDYDEEIIRNVLRKDIQPVCDKESALDAVWEMFVTSADDKLSILPKSIRFDLLDTLIPSNTTEKKHEKREHIINYMKSHQPGIYAAWIKLYNYIDPNIYGFWFGDVLKSVAANADYRDQLVQLDK